MYGKMKGLWWDVDIKRYFWDLCTQTCCWRGSMPSPGGQGAAGIPWQQSPGRRQGMLVRMGDVPTAAPMDLALQPSVWTAYWRFYQQTYGVHASWNFKNQSENVVWLIYFRRLFLKNFFFCSCERHSLTVQHKAENKFGFMQKALSDVQNNYT